MTRHNPEPGPRVDVREIRTRLGEFWGLGRPATLTELAGVLRLRGDSALQTATEWEVSGKPPSGPVTLALDLMQPPDDETVAAIAEEIAQTRLGPALPYQKIGTILSRAGEDPQETLALIVRIVAEALLTPPGLDAVIGEQPTESAETKARRYRAVVRPLARARRPAPEVVRIAPKKITKKITRPPLIPT